MVYLVSIAFPTASLVLLLLLLQFSRANNISLRELLLSWLVVAVIVVVGMIKRKLVS
jgi:hypothetical protein